MTEDTTTTRAARLSEALRTDEPSSRLQAALTAGIHADDA